jgi:heat shock protein HslJ
MMTRPLSLLILSLALVACTQTPSSAGDSPQSSPQDAPEMKDSSGKDTIDKHRSDQDRLSGYRWQLQDATDAKGNRIGALLVRPDQPLQFDLADGRIGIQNACNGIGGDLRIDGDSLHISALVSTKMACLDPAVMALDDEIAKRLQGAPRIQLHDGDPPRLTWTAANGDVLHFVGDPKAETRFGKPGETIYVEIAARKKPCPAPATGLCVEMRELRYDAQGLPAGEPGEWRLSQNPIEGYTHEDGIRNVARVKRFTIDQPSKPGPSTALVLDMVVESEMVDP